MNADKRKSALIRGFNHICQCSQGSSALTRLPKLIARNAKPVTILNRHHHTQQYHRRKRNDPVEGLVCGAVAYRHRLIHVGRRANDQFSQLVDCLGRCY